MQNLREPEHLFRTTVPPDVLIPPRTRHESENLSSLKDKDSPTPQRQRDRTGAIIEGYYPPPLARSAKSPPPPSLPASAGPFPRSPFKDTVIVKSGPFCVNRWDRPL